MSTTRAMQKSVLPCARPAAFEARHRGASRLGPPSGAALASSRRPLRGPGGLLAVQGSEGRGSRRPAAHPRVHAADLSSAPASLDSLPFKSIISVEGEVHPEEAEGVASSVFGIFDQAQQLQFVGFSKHLKNSLRTMLGRQTELCYFYKHVDFPDIDQEAMMQVRDAWFEENHGMPIGNTAAKRQGWQQPLSAGGISEKGKQVAARQLLETIQKKLDQRGLREEMVPSEEDLAKGVVEFLPCRELTEEEKEQKAEQRRKILEATKTCATVVDGRTEEFTLFFENIYESNGGAMVDCVVTKDDVATNHRIIIGEDYLKALNLSAEAVTERTVAFLLAKKVDRKTEGLLMSNQFPINYFALSTVEQHFDDFSLAFEEKALPGEDKFWRFNRIHDYGWSADDRFKQQQQQQGQQEREANPV